MEKDKKIVFAIIGDRDNGKTATIREIAKIISTHQELEGEFIYKIKNNNFCSDDKKEPGLKKIKKLIEEPEEEKEKEKPQDIRLIIYLNNGINIGIESFGDSGDKGQPLFESLEKFKKEKCDIIICSTRTTGKTVRIVDSLFNDKYDIVWVTNYRSWELDKETLNEISAKHIWELIETLFPQIAKEEKS